MVVDAAFSSLLIEELDGLEVLREDGEFLFEVAVFVVQDEGQRQVVIDVESVFLR